jgi:type I restriction enzyme R subunit
VGKVAEVLHRNPAAVQIGLTATPRELETSQATPEEAEDQKITADNVKHFGEAVYEYDMAQGIEDGYLAACEIVRRDIFLDQRGVNERESIVAPEDLAGKKVTDARTGELAVAEDAFGATDFEKSLMLPDRVRAMCRDLFDGLVEAGGPEQKTIVFCARDSHADAVATEMNNLYADWCAATKRKRADSYAFKCTASVEGSGFIADLRGASRHHFIATTVDLLTTGVDVPAVRNIVFFKYVRSPIAFYQMVGRGTRLDPPSGKLMFRVWDYTNATRLFGRDFRTKATVVKRPSPEPPADPPKTIRVEGFDVHVTEAGRFILTNVDGGAMPVTVEEYKERLAAKLVESAPTLEDFRARWITPQERRDLASMPDAGRSAPLIRAIEEMAGYDLYDVLAELGYGLAPRTRAERADAFGYKNQSWLAAAVEGGLDAGGPRRPVRSRRNG